MSLSEISWDLKFPSTFSSVENTRKRFSAALDQKYFVDGGKSETTKKFSFLTPKFGAGSFGANLKLLLNAFLIGLIVCRVLG